MELGGLRESELFRRLALSTDPSASLRISLGGSDDHPITPTPAALGTPTDAVRTAQDVLIRT
jgi:hypothetical protein